MGFNLERFKKAQEKDYSRALEEIKNGVTKSEKWEKFCFSLGILCVF